MTPQYLAGFIDGEGSLGIYRHNELSIQIAQINRRVLDQIQSQYGGRVLIIRSRQNKKGHIHQYYLSRRNQVKIMIEDILPYLIVKKQEAEIVLKFINTYTTHYGRDKGPNMKYKQDERNSLAKQLKELKQGVT